MEAVAQSVPDDWHSTGDAGGATTPGSSVPTRRRQDDAIDSMLQVPAQMFASNGEVHPGVPGVSLSFQRRIVQTTVPPAGHPHPAGHSGPPVLPPPPFPALHAPLPLGANAGRYPQLPALAPPPQKRNSGGSGGNSGGGGVNGNVGPSAGAGNATVTMGGTNGVGNTTAGNITPATRPVSELLALPSKDLSSAEHRRVRKVLLSRKRARRSGTVPAANVEIEAAEVAAKRPALDTAALARLDKKQIRQIKNRDVALKARQKAKAKVQRLESENTNLKNKALSLERENNLLRSQIESLKSTIGDPTREQSWNGEHDVEHGDVSLESMVAP